MEDLDDDNKKPAGDMTPHKQHFSQEHPVFDRVILRIFGILIHLGQEFELNPCDDGVESGGRHRQPHFENVKECGIERSLSCPE